MVKVDLSVIVINYNTGKFLEQCLPSVFTSIKYLSKGRRVEVIVVDNCSTDGSQELVTKRFPEVKLVCSDRNLGYSGGNNLGLRAASGKFVLFLNADVEIFPEALAETIDLMESDPKIGAMTPKTLLVSGGMDPDCHRGFPTPWASITYFLGLERLFPKSKLFGQYHQGYLGLDKNHEIDAGFGTYMVVRKEVIDKVGAWDDQYFFYGEDLDFFYRIKKAGYKVIFCAKPLLLHHKGGSSGLRKESKKTTVASRETRLNTAKASVRAMEIFYKKFYEGVYPRWVTRVVLFGIRLKGLFRILSHQLR